MPVPCAGWLLVRRDGYNSGDHLWNRVEMRPNAMREIAGNVDQQPEVVEQPAVDEQADVQARPKVLSRNEALFIFLACMLIGFIGTLVGFVPLIALAMIGPVVVSFLV
jgi:hypothetical protein